MGVNPLYKSREV